MKTEYFITYLAIKICLPLIPTSRGIKNTLFTAIYLHVGIGYYFKRNVLKAAALGSAWFQILI